MDLEVTGSPISSERPYPALDIIEFFKTRSSLVVAAVAALDAMPAELAALKALVASPDAPGLIVRLQAVVALVKGATVGTDNLLVADPVSADEPFVMCSVSRQPSGAVDVRTIELDRNALALKGAPFGQAQRPLDALGAAIDALKPGTCGQAIQIVSATIDALSAQVRASLSRLSIVKARLDLQQSFLASVMEAEAGASPPVRLDSHLDQAGARDMAMDARRLLSTGSLKIASGNRKMLTALFESHAAEHLATKAE